MKKLGLALCLTMYACGDGGLLLEDAPGGGSATLYVVAQVTTENLSSNAGDSSQYVTEIDVRIRRNNVPVNDAQVFVESDAGEITMAWDGDGDGRYRGAQAGYFRVYSLDIEAGNDYITGARVAGPDIHVFSAPLPGAAVPGGVPLEVTWERGSAADTARLETREMDQLTITDAGIFTVPAEGLRHSDSEIREERLRLWRENRVQLAGGVAGSTFNAEVRNDVEFLVTP